MKEKTPAGLTPLLTAAERGHTAVCELLLDKGEANIDKRESLGSTALIVDIRAEQMGRRL